MEKKRLKIAFLNISQGAVFRGGETLVENLASELAKKHDVEILAGKTIPPVRWPFVWRFFIDPHGLATLFFTLKQIPRLFRKRYDIVIPINGGWQAIIVRIVTKIYGGKMVISAQSGIGWDDRINLYSFPDACVVPATLALAWAKATNPNVPTWYIPNGVDLKRFSSKGEKYQTKLKKPIILCVGALVAQKRIDLVINAASKLANVSLLVVGKGELKDKLYKLGKKLMGERFELVSLMHEDMPKVYRVADVFSLVSTPSEAFGIVFVEAMAAGLPVVATNDPIRAEIVGEAGILVDPHDTNAYANALEEAIEKKWGTLPQKQAQKFSWEKIALEYEKIFSKLRA